MNLHILDEAFTCHPNYNLVITGHSLGAGTASILAFLLRPQYPDLWCYAFSPPGCLFNEALYTMSKDLIMSIVVGDDLVISVTWQSMEYFKLSLVDAIKQSTEPKVTRTAFSFFIRSYGIIISGWPKKCSEL